MTKYIATTIANTIANDADVYRNRDWVCIDTLTFHRHRLIEKMIDQLDWSVAQATDYAEKQKDRVRMAQRRFTGDEISTIQLQAAIAEARSASLNVEIMASELESLHQMLEDETGERYTAFKRSGSSNLRQDRQPAAMPADLAAQLAALGITPEAVDVANTAGTGEEGFTKKTA